MKLATTLVMVFIGLVATLSLAFPAGPVNVTAPEARTLMTRKPGMVLLDVRSPEEYQQAHLQGAKLIPLDQLEKRVQEVPRDKAVLVYCAVGARSLTAARLLSSKGYREVYQISDGIIGWYKSGFPVEKGGR